MLRNQNIISDVTETDGNKEGQNLIISTDRIIFIR